MRLALVRRLAFVRCLGVLLSYSALTGISNDKTYIPKSEEEVVVLYLVVASEIKANNWTKSELICFSIDGLDPSPKLVKSLRLRDSNVRSSGEWAKKFNCGFELQIEYTEFDLSRSIKVRSKVVDLREINKGEGDLALLQRNGEYSFTKADGNWSISDYVPNRQDTSTAPANWCKVDAGPFSILAPPGWEFHQLDGADSYVGEFVGNGIALKFDYGVYSNPLKEERKPIYVVVHKSIDGLAAKIVSPRVPTHGITGIYFRNAGNASALTLFGRDLTSTQQELVLKMFETLRFGGPAPRYVVPPPPPTKNTR